jgi:biopolymer transport protein ExbB/TolQ
VRIGAFNVIDTQGNYLSYANDHLSVLPRQPSGGYTGWASELANASSGMHRFGIDPTGPTGGSFLAAIIDSPTLEERWHQGGYVGYAITAVGIFAFLLAIFRLLVLTGVSAKVSKQLKTDKAMDNNPLGRVLKIHEDNPSMDLETLELKMSEGVMRETPKLESGLTLLKIIAAVAPLMGLLGTVTGMIITFQAITIFGAGDPKAMAGGISSALITTVLGLLVAIPTVLLHTVVNGRAQRIIHVLNEQATGIVAEHSESVPSKRGTDHGRLPRNHSRLYGQRRERTLADRDPVFVMWTLIFERLWFFSFVWRKEVFEVISAWEARRAQVLERQAGAPAPAVHEPRGHPHQPQGDHDAGGPVSPARAPRHRDGDDRGVQRDGGDRRR